jgi:hypothetical protein
MDFIRVGQTHFAHSHFSSVFRGIVARTLLENPLESDELRTEFLGTSEILNLQKTIREIRQTVLKCEGANPF